MQVVSWDCYNIRQIHVVARDCHVSPIVYRWQPETVNIVSSIQVVAWDCCNISLIQVAALNCYNISLIHVAA